MKKYFLTLATVALFAIGFSASDEEESSNSSSSSSSPQTEQKQETEAERHAREEAEKKTQKEEILKYGYKRGYDYGKSLQQKDALNKERWCKECFLNKCSVPKTTEEKAFYEEFKDQFYKGWEDALF